MENREKLSSRLGFILLSAGCAIGCGNVWKFPWMCGQYGGAAFVLIYILCLVVLGLPVMTMEFALGRAAQASPIKMMRKLEKPGQKWHVYGPFALLGNVALMSFYTVVTGWILHYFVSFVRGDYQGLSFAGVDEAGNMTGMIFNAPLNEGYMIVTIVISFAILCIGLQKGLERITKYMMVGLLALMIILAVRSCLLSNAGEGLKFYLVPDFSKVTGEVFVGAMNQAFFTLSLGIGSMAIFGSYIGKERSIMGESVRVICLDTFVALMAGLIIFPACFTYNGGNVNAGPGLLFDTMASVFVNMEGGRIWGSLFFLFMVFAALSTVLGVLENILAMVREVTGWSRIKGSIVCGLVLIALATTTALGYSVFHFQPFADGTAWLDFWDFIVSTNLLPLGSLCYVIFCCYKKFGWGWDNMIAEANAGEGMKVKAWMKPIFMYVVPAAVIVLYVSGLITFAWH